MAIKQLIDPKIEEVSLVDQGANLRTFFFVKNATKEETETARQDFTKANADIKIESNGTAEGTKIKINGKEISPIDFSFSMYSYDWDGDVYCNYAVEEKAEKGEFSNIKLYSLQKSLTPDADIQEKADKLKKSASIIQDVLKEEKLDHIGEDDVIDLAKSLDVLADYKELVPPDAAEAINVLTKMAVKKSSEQVNKETEIKKEEKEVTEEKKDKEDIASEKTEVAAEETVETPKTDVEIKEVTADSDVSVKITEKEELTKLVADLINEMKNVKNELAVLKNPGDEVVDVSVDELAQTVIEALNS